MMPEQTKTAPGSGAVSAARPAYRSPGPGCWRRQNRTAGQALQQVALAHVDGLFQAVVGHVFLRHAHGVGVNIHGHHIRRAQPRGGDGQDAAAGAHVQHLAAPVIPLDQLHAHGGGLVGAGAEGHARVDLDDQVAGLFVPGFPGGLDHQMLGHAEGLKILLPVFRPVLFLHALQGHVQRAHIGSLQQRQLLPQEADDPFRLSSSNQALTCTSSGMASITD